MPKLTDVLGSVAVPTWKRRPEVLLCPNVPKPLHGVAPRVVLGQDWWDAERQAAYASTGYHCVACGVHKSQAKVHQCLEGHELYATDYAAGTLTYLETVPLCHLCHNYIHDGRLQAMLDKGQITEEFYDQVLKHGDDVLFAAGVDWPKQYSDRIAEWGDWRLIVNGVKYPPKFKTFEEWRKAYA